MLAAWMLFVCIVTLLCGASALAAERIALIVRRPSRWIWAGSIASPIAITLLAQRSTSAAEPQTLESLGLAREVGELSAIAESPVVWMAERLTDPSASSGSETWLVAVWLCSSIVLSIHLLLTWVALRRRLASAQVSVIGDTPIMLTADLGPAVTGFVRPRICMPSWIDALSENVRHVALDHEHEHLLAGDTKLHGLSLLVLVAMPWNVPLWWMHHRLRLAIEIDCDRRVLRRGYSSSDYGRALLEIACRGPSRELAAMGLYESASLLERRIQVMRASRRKAWKAAVALLAVTSFSTFAFAATLDAPKQTLQVWFAGDGDSALPLIPSPVGSVMDGHDELASALRQHFPELASARVEANIVVWLLTNEHGAVAQKLAQTLEATEALDFTDAAWAQRAKAFGIDEAHITEHIVLDSNVGPNRVAVAWMVQPGITPASSGGPLIRLPGSGTSIESRVVRTALAHRSVIEHFDPKAIREGTPHDIELWFVMDANGSVLRAGRRATITDPELARRDIEQRLPGVRVAYVERGTAVKNTRGERVRVSWHWLQGDSPLPREDTI